MAAKPPVIPELYTGEKSWDEWIDHFDSVAQVCGWDAATKLKWLRVRLTGRAGTVFRCLPETTRADFDLATAAMKSRFEPESKKELYRTQLLTRKKKQGEGWAAFGDDLRILADRAYPDLPEEARERFALNQYLAQLDNPQVAFSVKQTKPKTVDDAVRSTLEMESFLKPSASAEVSQVSLESESTEAVATMSARTQDDVMKMILERMDRIETELKSVRQLPASESSRAPSRGRWRGRSSRSNPGNCWNCGGEGHLARDCPTPKKPRQQQGNGEPPLP